MPIPTRLFLRPFARPTAHILRDCAARARKIRAVRWNCANTEMRAVYPYMPFPAMDTHMLSLFLRSESFGVETLSTTTRAPVDAAAGRNCDASRAAL